MCTRCQRNGDFQKVPIFLKQFLAIYPKLDALRRLDRSLISRKDANRRSTAAVSGGQASVQSDKVLEPPHPRLEAVPACRVQRVEVRPLLHGTVRKRTVRARLPRDNAERASSCSTTYLDLGMAPDMQVRLRPRENG